MLNGILSAVVNARKGWNYFGLMWLYISNTLLLLPANIAWFLVKLFNVIDIFTHLKILGIVCALQIPAFISQEHFSNRLHIGIPDGILHKPFRQGTDYFAILVLFSCLEVTFVDILTICLIK